MRIALRIIGWILFGIALLVGAIYGIEYLYEDVFDKRAQIERAINNHDFSKAHKNLKLLKDTNNEDYELYADKVFNAEVSFLLDENSENSSDRLLAALADYGVYGSPVAGVTSNKDIISNNEEFMLSVSKFNQRIDGVMSRAISMKNQYLAEKLLNLYKSTLTKQLYESHLFKKDEYIFEYSDEPKENARLVYENALAEKKFE